MLKAKKDKTQSKYFTFVNSFSSDFLAIVVSSMRLVNSLLTVSKMFLRST